MEPLFSKFFDDFKICVAPENKGRHTPYHKSHSTVHSRGSLDVGWDITDHRKCGAPSGSVRSSRPRQRSNPSSHREEILQRMKAAAVIVLVLSTVVTSVVIHRLLRPILERNEYYASGKRERENRGVTENILFVSCGTAVHLERHEKIRNIFCGTSICCKKNRCCFLFVHGSYYYILTAQLLHPCPGAITTMLSASGNLFKCHEEILYL